MRVLIESPTPYRMAQRPILIQVKMGITEGPLVLFRIAAGEKCEMGLIWGGAILSVIEGRQG